MTEESRISEPPVEPGGLNEQGNSAAQAAYRSGTVLPEGRARDKLLEDLNCRDAETLLAWAAGHGERAAIVTSFQHTGCIMVDMAHRAGLGLRVVTVDTLRLPPETYELMDEVEARYGITIERFRPDPAALRRMIERHGEFLFFDGKEQQETCCRIRKVEPNERALATMDVWITGLRRDQSAHRGNVPRAALAERAGRPLIRLCPLVNWTERDVQAYVRRHDLPYNRLYDQGYESIGCQICTTPVRPGEPKRAGRWRWLNHLADQHKKECGMHRDGSGI